jgi:hypothetical protein
MTRGVNRERAPIALFTYRRTDLLGSVLDSLEACPEFSQSDVFVFSDGPKDAFAAAGVTQVRALLRKRQRPNMTLVESQENLGLANSIIAGVTRLCDEYGRAIVIEDDLIVSPALLTWLNAALDRYANERQVMQVSGHAFDVPALRSRREGVFLPVTTSWGWATWKRAWSKFDPEARGWSAIKTDRALRRRFDLESCYPYSKMLERQMNGEVDSWAIRWYWTCFILNGVTLFPPRSLIANEGNDATATHRGMRSRVRGQLTRKRRRVDEIAPQLPISITVESATFAAVRRAIWCSTSKFSPLYWLTR